MQRLPWSIAAVIGAACALGCQSSAPSHSPASSSANTSSQTATAARATVAGSTGSSRTSSSHSSSATASTASSGSTAGAAISSTAASSGASSSSTSTGSSSAGTTSAGSSTSSSSASASTRTSTTTGKTTAAGKTTRGSRSSTSGRSSASSTGGGNPDGGEADAGAADGGQTDADGGLHVWPQSPDGGVLCVEPGQFDVFAPISGSFVLPRDKGRILACEHVETVTAQELSDDDAGPFPSLGWTADNGYDRYIIQYVSEGPVGTVRRVSALVYAPDTGGTDMPFAAVNHGTSGMGQSCGPSQLASALSPLEGMALPLVGRGYAVVATDYPGMGVEGEPISPYTEGQAEGLAVLDAVRALLHFHDTRFDAHQLGSGFFLVGHSQGGQATLFAHQLYDPSVGATLLGSVAFAPALGDIRFYGYLLGTSWAPTELPGVVLTMSLYGDAVYYGIDAGTWLTPGAQASLPGLFANECLDQLLNDLPAAEPTIGDEFTTDFINAAGSCGLDGGPCPAWEPWYSQLLADEPGNFASSAPVLIMQGGEDDVVPANFTSCISARLDAERTPQLSCLYATAQHTTIVQQSIADAFSWMETVRSGGTVLLCPALVPLVADCPPY